MDRIEDALVVHPSLSIRTHGRPITLPAKISNGIMLDGNAEYLAIEDQSDACISSISRCCQHGLTVSTWTKFRRLENGMLFFSTGSGIKVRTCILACVAVIVRPS